MLSSCSDAYVALGRIGAFLTAEELGDHYTVDPESKYAVQVDGDFAWEANVSPKEAAAKPGAKHNVKQAAVLPTTATPLVDEDVQAEKDEKPFELLGMKVKVPKGAFVAIVGRVGSGKSSLLQAMIGEMRKTRGEVCQGIVLCFLSFTAT